MVVIEAQGLEKAAANMDAMVARLQDLTPVNRAFASTLRREITQAFNNSRSPKGEKFDPIKPSTARNRKKRKANVQSGGSLESQLMASLQMTRAGIKPLIDTNRSRRSIGIIAARDGIKIFYVGYLRPHVTGGGVGKKRPPKRNPLPVEKTGGQLQLIDRLRQDLSRRTLAYVRTGRVI